MAPRLDADSMGMLLLLPTASRRKVHPVLTLSKIAVSALPPGIPRPNEHWQCQDRESHRACSRGHWSVHPAIQLFSNNLLRVLRRLRALDEHPPQATAPLHIYPDHHVSPSTTPLRLLTYLSINLLTWYQGSLGRVHAWNGICHQLVRHDGSSMVPWPYGGWSVPGN